MRDTTDHLQRAKATRIAHRIRKRIEAYRIAEHYVQNGLRFAEAYAAVTGKKIKKNKSDPFSALGDNATDFLRGVDIALGKVKVRKDALLRVLWAAASSSPLDFLNDDGTVLPIKELKKLPREIQAIIEDITVRVEWVPVKDDQGRIVMLGDGKPALRRIEKAEIKVVDKAKAQRLFAELKKWIGQSVVLQSRTTNVAVVMQQMESQRARMESLYTKRPQITTEHESGDEREREEEPPVE